MLTMLELPHSPSASAPPQHDVTLAVLVDDLRLDRAVLSRDAPAAARFISKPHGFWVLSVARGHAMARASSRVRRHPNLRGFAAKRSPMSARYPKSLKGLEG